MNEKKKFVAAMLSLRDGVPVAVPGEGDRLFLGSVGAASNQANFFFQGPDPGVTHVLVVGTGLPTPFQDRGVVYEVIQVEDKPSARLSEHFGPSIKFIEDVLDSAQENRMLVHCFQGKSRSVAILGAFLIKKHKIGLDEAMERIRTVRPQAEPNLGFAAELRAFAKSV